MEQMDNNLLRCIIDEDYEGFQKSIEGLFPIDIALMIEGLDDENLRKFVGLAGDQLTAEILEQADERLQTRFIEMMNFKKIIAVFSKMSNDDIADILGQLPINMRKDILKLMTTGDHKVIKELLGYAEDSAGGIMTTEYIAIKEGATVGETLRKIKEIAPETEVIETIFIVDNTKKLVGTADLRKILIESEDKRLGEIMNENVISVFPELDQENVTLLVSKYDLNVIPVVNHRNSLLGIITVDDIIDVMVEEHTEDILRLGGVSREEKVDSEFKESVKMRLPWLFINLITAFLASMTVGLFEGTISQVVALAAAMPIVAGMGGNAGTQTLSVVIRSIALGEVNPKKSLPLVIKEIFLGVVDGAATGLVTGIVLYFIYGNIYLGLIIFLAMIINLVIAGFSGFIIPIVLDSFGIDPALASSIFLTTATDVCGFFVFLGLAQMFLPLLK